MFPSGSGVGVAYWADIGSGRELRVDLLDGHVAILAASTDAVGLVAAAATPAGRPVVAFDGEGYVKVATCGDELCSGVEVVEIEQADVDDLAVAVAGDGLPFIAYYDVGRGRLGLVHCTVEDCAETEVRYLPVGRTQPAGDHVAATVAADGLPLVAFSPEQGSVAVLRCGDLACNAASLVEISREAAPSSNAAVAVGSSAAPVVAFVSATGGPVVVTCHDPACTATTTEMPRGGGIGELDLAVAANGYPMLVVGDGQSVELGFCGSTSCSAATWVPVYVAPASILSLALSPDQVPAVSHTGPGGVTVQASG